MIFDVAHNGSAVYCDTGLNAGKYRAFGWLYGEREEIDRALAGSFSVGVEQRDLAPITLDEATPAERAAFDEAVRLGIPVTRADVRALIDATLGDGKDGAL